MGNIMAKVFPTDGERSLLAVAEQHKISRKHKSTKTYSQTGGAADSSASVLPSQLLWIRIFFFAPDLIQIFVRLFSSLSCWSSLSLQCIVSSQQFLSHISSLFNSWNSSQMKILNDLEKHFCHADKQALKLLLFFSFLFKQYDETWCNWHNLIRDKPSTTMSL